MAERRVEHIPDSLLEQVAAIVGPSSAAARALADMQRRRQSGQDVACYRDLGDRTWLVGPRLVVRS